MHVAQRVQSAPGNEGVPDRQRSCRPVRGPEFSSGGSSAGSPYAPVGIGIWVIGFGAGRVASRAPICLKIGRREFSEQSIRFCIGEERFSIDAGWSNTAIQLGRPGAGEAGDPKMFVAIPISFGNGVNGLFTG